MTRADVDGWLERYVVAWGAYDRGEIGELFAEGATYRYHPADEPVTGRAAIVESWFEDQDAPGSFEAAYSAYAVEGDRAVATGVSSYASGNVYDNVFLLAFDGDGRCTELIEWYVQRPAK